MILLGNQEFSLWVFHLMCGSFSAISVSFVPGCIVVFGIKPVRLLNTEWMKWNIQFGIKCPLHPQPLSFGGTDKNSFLLQDVSSKILVVSLPCLLMKICMQTTPTNQSNKQHSHIYVTNGQIGNLATMVWNHVKFRRTQWSSLHQNHFPFFFFFSDLISTDGQKEKKNIIHLCERTR